MQKHVLILCVNSTQYAYETLSYNPKKTKIAVENLEVGFQLNAAPSSVDKHANRLST